MSDHWSYNRGRSYEGVGLIIGVSQYKKLACYTKNWPSQIACPIYFLESPNNDIYKLHFCTKELAYMDVDANFMAEEEHLN